MLRQIFWVRSFPCLASDVAVSLPKMRPRHDDSTLPALHCLLLTLVGSSQDWGGGTVLEASLCSETPLLIQPIIYLISWFLLCYIHTHDFQHWKLVHIGWQMKLLP